MGTPLLFKNYMTAVNLAIEKQVYSILLFFTTRRDLANFLYHAIQLNIAVGGGDHLVSEALYFADPEGNGIEVYQDRPTDEWQWRDGFVKMDTQKLMLTI